VLDVVEAFSWASDSIHKMVAYFEGTAEGRQQLAAAAAAATAPVHAAAAAAAAAGGATGRLNGLSEEQQWAMIQAEGQSQSLQQQELQERQQQQQQSQAELQQQLLQGYLFLGNLIDVYGALGRGSAAEAHRQRLAAAAAAARRTKAEQQQQQQHGQRRAVNGQTQLHIVNGQLKGVKLTGKKAKKLKIAGLDKQPGGHTAAAAAGPAAAAAAAGAAPVVTVSRLVADPQMLAVIDLGIGKKSQRMRPQVVLEQYGSSLRAVAAAEDALKRTDLAAAAAAAQTARDCLADAAGAALAAADVKKTTDVAALLEATEVSTEPHLSVAN
jgi:hypothetical protein